MYFSDLDKDEKLDDAARSKIEQFSNMDYDGYKISGYCGSGLSGYVLRAEKGRDVKAIKIPKHNFFDSIIIEGGKQLAKIKGHPNIVEIDGDGHFEHENGFPYSRMEFIDGQDLEYKLGMSSGIGIDVDTSIDILREVAQGMKYAHSKGVYHYDLRPSNIIIQNNGDIKLTDFGLLRFALTSEDAELREAAKGYKYKIRDRFGKSMGSFEPADNWLPRSARENGEYLPVVDVFQFGKVAYYMLTGSVPSGIPPKVSSKLGSQFSMIDDLLSNACQDDEKSISVSFDDFLGLFARTQDTESQSLLENKITTFSSQLDFSLKNISTLSKHKGKDYVRRIEKEKQKMISNINFLIDNYSDIIDFASQKGLTSVDDIPEQLYNIRVGFQDRCNRDVNSMANFLDSRNADNKDPADLIVVGGFKEYINRLKRSPSEIRSYLSDINVRSNGRNVKVFRNG